MAVCEALITQAGHTPVYGQMLTTGNWYSAVALAIPLFEKYGWALVGMIIWTDKGVHDKLDTIQQAISGYRGSFEESFVLQIGH